jgi:hypothetical protein
VGQGGMSSLSVHFARAVDDARIGCLSQPTLLEDSDATTCHDI